MKNNEVKRAGPGPDIRLYVANEGCDAWSGGIPARTPDGRDGPFKTLERARDEVRKLRSAGWRGAAEITVRGGEYFLPETFELEAADSGVPGSPVVYRAGPNEKATLSGGKAIPPEAFGPVTDAGALARLAPEARGHVLQANLKTCGIAAFGDFPVAFQGFPDVPELFFNGQRMTLARWPNEGWVTIAKIIAPGSWFAPATCETTDEGGVFEYEGDRPARWDVEGGVWLHGYWCFDWYDEVIRIKAIDRERRRIALAAPARYGVKPRNPSPRRWRALNLLEELDCPGEYFIDRGAGALYFWPPGPLQGARIAISTLKTPVVAVKDASHVVLRGFTVEAALGNGIEVSGGGDVRIQACEVRNTRELGIKVSGGIGHRVEACDVHDTGKGGITLTGGDRRTLEPGAHAAFNNHVWRFSIHKMTSAHAIALYGVGNIASHNLIHDAPHQAVYIGGNENIVEYNIIHHVCVETDDCGALYKGRNPSCRGNIIRFNFFHHIGSPMGHGNAAIYFDDGDGGDLVLGNVFFRCGEPGKGHFGSVYSHGGHGIRAENNIFVECKRAVGSGPWSDEKWKKIVTGLADLLLKEVDITKPPYSTRYPELAGLMDFAPGKPRVSLARLNVLVNCADTSSGNWQVPPGGNFVTDRDPGFVNASGGDFTLKAGAEVFSKLPGFQPVPFDQIGLVRDALRPDPVADTWIGV